MGANNTFITGIGGFRNGVETEVVPSAYVGDAGVLPGAGEMTASVMFRTKPNYASNPEPQFLFGNIGAGNTGWGIRILNSGNDEAIRAQAQVGQTSGTTLADTGAEGIQAGGVFVATMSLSSAGNVLRCMLNGAKATTAFAIASTYGPSTDRPSIGVSGPTPLSETIQAAISLIVLGCGYAESFFTDEQVWLHQAACLQTGDFVDGNLGGGIAGAGMPSFTNRYSARRGNNGIGVATANFIAAQLGFPFAALGNLPPGGATWADENTTSPINFTRQTGSVSGQTLFVYGQKSFYSGG